VHAGDALLWSIVEWRVQRRFSWKKIEGAVILREGSTSKRSLSISTEAQLRRRPAYNVVIIFEQTLNDIGVEMRVLTQVASVIKRVNVEKKVYSKNEKGHSTSPIRVS